MNFATTRIIAGFMQLPQSEWAEIVKTFNRFLEVNDEQREHMRSAALARLAEEALVLPLNEACPTCGSDPNQRAKTTASVRARAVAGRMH